MTKRFSRNDLDKLDCGMDEIVRNAIEQAFDNRCKAMIGKSVKFLNYGDWKARRGTVRRVFMDWGGGEYDGRGDWYVADSTFSLWEANIRGTGMVEVETENGEVIKIRMENIA